MCKLKRHGQLIMSSGVEVPLPGHDHVPGNPWSGVSSSSHRPLTRFEVGINVDKG